MKHSIFLKAVAVVLAACALTVALGSGFGVALAASSGLYTTDYDTWQTERFRSRAEGLATALAESYAARTLSGLSVQELEQINWGNSWQTIGMWHDLGAAQWCYTIRKDGLVQETTYDRSFDGCEGYRFEMRVSYPVEDTDRGAWSESYSIYAGQEQVSQMLYLKYVQSPLYTVTVWFAPGSVQDYNGISLDLYSLLLQQRYVLIASLAVSLLVAAVCIVYLCCAAGKKRAGDIPTPGGLNRLPLDLYGSVCVAVLLVAYLTTKEIVEEFLYYSAGANWGWLALGILPVFAGALCIVGFLFALAAQWKMRGLYVWKHCLIGWCSGKLWIGIRYSTKALCKLFGMLPMIWQYLLIAVGMAAVPMFFAFCCVVTYDLARAFWMLMLFGSLMIDLAIILYGAYAYGSLLKGARKMASGDLYSKIDTRFLIGSYERAAKDLNALADVAQVAAKNQSKSDRMKTELITNVSHDIKTPLTSIINYIDLLQKAETPEQRVQYLEVLDRQSQRLKKLIEDLMEMSKATTGDMAVDITVMDAVEAVNQALGEFADKLAAKELNVVFRQPEKPISVFADGRLTWRVLSNLLSNVVKYALPGTRVYVDMQQFEGRLLVSIKNISMEELNVSADELTERFVRGDLSRNTEGSGLGLNIAKSLMELQKGQLSLLVDGDLFKVTLNFPGA